MAETREALLRPDRNCWRIEHADRFALIVDAADYFKAVKAAILEARHSVMLIGWDFDTRIKLEPDNPDPVGPARLGRFLNWVAKRRPDLTVCVLKWRLGALRALGRGTTPLFILNWMTRRSIRFRLDGVHPTGAAHHQKLVVIDDAIAFCGGIDMTSERWDRRPHLDGDPFRIDSGGRPYSPWHDATTAVDGAAARALGDLARDRWERATGERLPRPPARDDCWPAMLVPDLRGVEVAIARTLPAMAGRGQVAEIERLYFDAIAGARRSLYIESQYFASRKLAEAMAARLREPEGPEILLVNPLSADGWLEEATMDSARARLLHYLARSDPHGRFRIVHPVTAAGDPIYVHAKVMIVDDRLLKVGSSNLNNRSLGFDTECDLAVEAPVGTAAEGAVRARIAAIRDDLLAEHLGTAPAAVAAAIAASGGSLLGAVYRLNRTEGRRLVAVRPRPLSDMEEVIAETDLVDPERPRSLWRRLRRMPVFRRLAGAAQPRSPGGLVP
ncbi:MAG: phospholipase D-like domain-containing protein [Alphaproteobacteria bacterium]